jgi:hypothetical protein
MPPPSQAQEMEQEELEGEFEHIMALDPSKEDALSTFDLLNRVNDAERECSSITRKFDSCKKEVCSNQDEHTQCPLSMQVRRESSFDSNTDPP